MAGHAYPTVAGARPGESLRATVTRHIRDDPNYDEEKHLERIRQDSLQADLASDDHGDLQRAIEYSLRDRPDDDQAVLEAILQESLREATARATQQQVLAEYTGMLSEEEQLRLAMEKSQVSARTASRSTPPSQSPVASTHPSSAPSPSGGGEELGTLSDDLLARAIELSLQPDPPATTSESPVAPIAERPQEEDEEIALQRTLQASRAEEEERRRQEEEERQVQEALEMSLIIDQRDYSSPSGSAPSSRPPVNVNPLAAPSPPPPPVAPSPTALPRTTAAHSRGRDSAAGSTLEERQLQEALELSRRENERAATEALLKEAEDTDRALAESHKDIEQEDEEQIKWAEEESLKEASEARERQRLLLHRSSGTVKKSPGAAWAVDEFKTEIEVEPTQWERLDTFRGKLDNHIIRLRVEDKVEVTVDEKRSVVVLRPCKSKVGAMLSGDEKGLQEAEDRLDIAAGRINEALKCPEEFYKERDSWHLHTYIDWSNIVLGAGGRARVDPARFVALVEGDRRVRTKYVVGSRGCAFNEAWHIFHEHCGYKESDKYEEGVGKEKAVDMALRERLSNLMIREWPGKRKIVLCTGDGNFRNAEGQDDHDLPSFPDLVLTALGKGFCVELYSWKASLSKNYLGLRKHHCSHFVIKFLDDYRDYLCKDPDEPLEYTNGTTLPGSVTPSPKGAKSRGRGAGGGHQRGISSSPLDSSRSPRKTTTIADLVPNLDLSDKAVGRQSPAPSSRSMRGGATAGGGGGGGGGLSAADPVLNECKAAPDAKKPTPAAATRGSMAGPIGPGQKRSTSVITATALAPASDVLSTYKGAMSGGSMSSSSRGLEPRSAAFQPSYASGSFYDQGMYPQSQGFYQYHGQPGPYSYQPSSGYATPMTNSSGMMMMGSSYQQPSMTYHHQGSSIMGGGLYQSSGIAPPPPPSASRPNLYEQLDARTARQQSSVATSSDTRPPVTVRSKTPPSPPASSSSSASTTAISNTRSSQVKLTTPDTKRWTWEP